jgi:uncharacterized protein (TIGR02266 family)
MSAANSGPVFPPPLPHQHGDDNDPTVVRRMPVPPVDAPQSVASPDERRQYTRIELEVEIDFIGLDNFYSGFTEDISEGGLFVATYELKALGTEFDLVFSLPDGYEIKTRAVVRWLRDPHNVTEDSHPGMGLQFIDLAPEHRRAIESFTRQREPIFYGE